MKLLDNGEQTSVVAPVWNHFIIYDWSINDKELLDDEISKIVSQSSK